MKIKSQHQRMSRSFRRLWLIGSVCIGLVEISLGQTPSAHLEGKAFREWIVENFYVNYNQLSYRQARLEMYNDIDNVEGIVEGVYSGFKKEVINIQTPGNALPINAEHTVPQSFFDKRSPMRSDIHHLFPTFDRWNGLRSNHPFAEIEDNETERWLRVKERLDEKPTKDLEEYAEYANKRFEPRESHKGNLARAVFYFYTMYAEEGNITQVGTVNTFLLWHLLDPVDEAERKRNDGVEAVQGNRNPYIDHPDWVERAWSTSEGTSSGFGRLKVMNWEIGTVDNKKDLKKHQQGFRTLGEQFKPQFVRVSSVAHPSYAKKICKYMGLKRFKMLVANEGKNSQLVLLVEKKLRKNRPMLNDLRADMEEEKRVYVEVGSREGIPFKGEVGIVGE